MVRSTGKLNHLGLLFGCSIIDEKTIVDIRKEFPSQKTDLEVVIRYVEGKYFNEKKYSSYNNLSFVPTNQAYERGNVISDSIVSSLFRRIPISGITFKKNSNCLDKFSFDLVRFKLDRNSINSYYYEYDFCNGNKQEYESSNYKSIILSNNWNLVIEKN